jgi:hypothetical protein
VRISVERLDEQILTAQGRVWVLREDNQMLWLSE